MATNVKLGDLKPMPPAFSTQKSEQHQSCASETIKRLGAIKYILNDALQIPPRHLKL